MSWLLGGRSAAAISDALADDEGRILVAFDARLARRLAGPDRDILFLAATEREASRAKLEALVYPAGRELDLETGSVAAAVAVDVARRDDGAEIVAELARVVRPGGRMFLIDRGARIEASRCALLGGLSRLEQTAFGRSIVTEGKVPRRSST